MKYVASMWVASFLGTCAWVTGAGCSGDDFVFGESSSEGAGQRGSGSGAAQGSGGESTGARPGSASSGETSSTGTAIGGEGPGPAGSGSGGRPEPSCGDFICDPSECGTCAPDCGATCLDGCGNGSCDDGEDCASCPADCQLGCGDGCCLLGEDCASCPADCGTPESCDPDACGNGHCNYGAGESCLNCADCFGLCGCGDDVCADPETEDNCPWDCGG